MKQVALLAMLAVILGFAVSTSANSIPTRGRSDYGQAGSLILDTATTSFPNGVVINSQEFCSDAETDPGSGTCQLAFAFQITSTLPAGGQSLTISLPIPNGAFFESAGLLTNDDPIAGGNIFFSPFSQADVLALPAAAITVDPLGNTFTFALPITLAGQGTNLALFLNVGETASLNGDGFYCYQAGTSTDPDTPKCAAKDVPPIPVPDVNLVSTPMPEPASLSLLGMGLVGLGGLYRRRRKNS